MNSTQMPSASVLPAGVRTNAARFKEPTEGTADMGAFSAPIVNVPALVTPKTSSLPNQPR